MSGIWRSDSIALRWSSCRLWAERMPAEALICDQMIRADERQQSQDKETKCRLKMTVATSWPPQVTQNPAWLWSLTLRNHFCVDHLTPPPITSHHLSCWWSFTFGFVLLRPWVSELQRCPDTCVQISIHSRLCEMQLKRLQATQAFSMTERRLHSVMC